tara:strand:+ start:139 stop:312 length:174 start_codon:yes stop_codon:yes gene_type:complete
MKTVSKYSTLARYGRKAVVILLVSKRRHIALVRYTNAENGKYPKGTFKVKLNQLREF